MNGINHNGSIDYQTLTELSEINSIASEWDALLERCRCNRAFSCSKWFLTTPELFPELSPLVLVARRDGAIAGVMPLMLDPHDRTARSPDSWSDYYDIIAEDWDMAVIAGLLDLATSGAGKYEKLALSSIRRDSNCVRAAQMLLPGSPVEQLFVPQSTQVYAYVDLSRGYDGYMQTLSRRFRHTQNGVRNKAHKSGLVVRELKEGDIRSEDLSSVFMSLHLSRIGERTALRELNSSESFLAKLLPLLFEERRMKVFAALVENRVVGIQLAMIGKNSLFGWNAGFSPEVRRCSPGRLLFEEAIRQACSDGLAEYDFGWWGSHEYKAHWRPSAREIGELEFTTSAARPRPHHK